MSRKTILPKNMKSPEIVLLKLLPALIVSTCFSVAHAIPKAAEDESAPVTTGADVAKPSPAKTLSKKNTPDKAKKPTTKRSAKRVRPAPRTNARHGKK